MSICPHEYPSRYGATRTRNVTLRDFAYYVRDYNAKNTSCSPFVRQSRLHSHTSSSAASCPLPDYLFQVNPTRSDPSSSPLSHHTQTHTNTHRHRITLFLKTNRYVYHQLATQNSLEKFSQLPFSLPVCLSVCLLCRFVPNSRSCPRSILQWLKIWYTVLCSSPCRCCCNRVWRCIHHSCH